MASGFVRVAGWEQFAWLRVGFSRRDGGGTSVYGGDGEQNLGWTEEDDAAVVAANRLEFVKTVGGDIAFELVTVRQMHGAVVQLVQRDETQLATAEGKASLVGDGLMTRESGLMIGMQTADCVPVLMVDTRLRAVAAIHAGWRGTVAGIVGEGVVGMQREFGSRAGDLVAAVGPSIGACCFEVGPEVGEAFRASFGYAAEVISQGTAGKLRVDLWEANRRQLLDAGLSAGAITVVGECTACSRFANGRRRYFSHRAEKGRTGRMLSVAGVEKADRL